MRSFCQIEHNDSYWHQRPVGLAKEARGMQLLINQIIVFNDVTYRVICILRGQVALFDVSCHTPKLHIFDLETLENGLESGQITKAADIYSARRYPAKDSKAEKHMLSNYELIKPIVTAYECLFDPSLRRRLIRTVAGGNSSVKRQIDRLLPVYWKKGQNKRALMPQYGVKARGSIRNNAKKTGRANKDGTKALPLNNPLRELFEEVIRTKILVEDRLSVRKAFDFVMQKFNEDPKCYTQ